MNSKTSKILFLFILSISLISYAADGNKKNQTGLNKPQGNPVRTFLNINNISTQIYNDGNSDIDPSGNSGLVFPRGSGKTAVFESGFLWGAKIAGDPQVRVGGSAYRQGLQPGKIISPGVAENPDLPKNRIYRVRPDIYPGGPFVDLGSAPLEEGLSASAIREQYEKDWLEWPWQDGAPFDDKNNNGVYEPTIDVPGVKGADQTIWFVANDLDPSKTTFLYGAQPLGIEMQATIWAYSQSGALGNMFFRKYKIINKSTNTFDSMYVSMWSDIDLGNSVDDFAGCDTLLSLGYCYNANANDDTYKPLPPPAVGFDFFQGPLLDGVAGEDRNKNGIDDSEDYGIFDGKVVGPGKINLPMSAFYYFARGDASVTDPTQGAPQGSTQFYNFFQGKIGLTGAPFTDPNTGKQTPYALPGDPQTRTGWIDGQLLPAGDRRIGLASGPFQMAPGDTQEVVVAEICAGAIPGTDRLSAIGLLKFYDQQAQLAYDNFFDLPVAPPAPEVNVIQLDKEIVLDWGFDNAKVLATETSDSKGYKFQGYNVYQLPSASSDATQGKRIATFDIVDGVGKIEDFFFDANTGVVAKGVRQFGNDTGIKRYLSIKNDELKGGTPLINGIRYYFAVTAYSYNPDPNAVPNNLENPLKVLTVVPSTTGPGIRFGALHGDTIKTSHPSGNSDGAVLPIVIDPTRLTGHTYRVTFDTMTNFSDPSHPVLETYWKLTDVTLNTVLLDKQFNQSGDDEYQFVDGMLLKVQGPPPGVKQDDQFTTDDESKWGWSIPKGTRRFTWANADGLEFEGFNHAIGWASPASVFGSGIPGVPADKLKKVLLRLARVPDGSVNYNPTFDPNDPNLSYGYRYGRAFAGPPAKPEFAPFIINPSGGYSYQDFTKSVPLSAWDITTDPNNPRRLAVGHLENNVAGGLVDGKWWPGDHNAFNNTAGSGPREWLWIFDADYSETPNPAFQVEAINNPLPIMYFLTVNRRGAAPFSPGASGDDEFQINPNFVNGLNDVFSFTAPAPSSSLELAKQDVEKINVFPNPYYGANSEELNKYNRFVTFSHLPAKATIRIFNLAGVLVKTIEKNSTSQFERWDLANNSGLPVASGLYIAHIDMPDIGKTKILKLAIIQEQQILDRF